jgi:hypothetical protein
VELFTEEEFPYFGESAPPPPSLASSLPTSGQSLLSRLRGPRHCIFQCPTLHEIIVQVDKMHTQEQRVQKAPIAARRLLPLEG